MLFICGLLCFRGIHSLTSCWNQVIIYRHQNQLFLLGLIYHVLHKITLSLWYGVFVFAIWPLMTFEHFIKRQESCTLAIDMKSVQAFILEILRLADLNVWPEMIFDFYLKQNGSFIECGPPSITSRSVQSRDFMFANLCWHHSVDVWSLTWTKNNKNDIHTQFEISPYFHFWDIMLRFVRFSRFDLSLRPQVIFISTKNLIGT